MSRVGVLVVVLGAMASGCLVARAEQPPNEVAVVIATRDLAAGETVTLEDVSQRRLPAEWATTSSVKPDSANDIINQRVNLPVMKGDILYWSFFEVVRSDESQDRCRQLTQSGKSAVEQLARARQVVLRRSPD
jgi:Flp pilus assembly protein CpaB